MSRNHRTRKRRGEVRAYRPEPESEAAWRARLARIRQAQAFGEAAKVLRAAGEPGYFKAADVAANGGDE